MKEAFLVDEKSGKKYDLWEPRWCSEEKSPLSFSKTDGITPQSIKKVPDQSGVMKSVSLQNTGSS